MWIRRGKRGCIATPGSNARIAVCGAFKWPHGPFTYSYGPRSVNTDLFIRMLRKLRHRARSTGRIIILVIDNVSAHRSKRSTIELKALSEFIDVFWLPKYSSEKLNDIENVWKHIKENYFCRMLVNRREDFAKQSVKLLDSFKKRGKLRHIANLNIPQHLKGGQKLVTSA